MRQPLTAALSLVCLVLASCSSGSSVVGPSGLSDDSNSVGTKAAVLFGYTAETDKVAADTLATIIELELRYPVSVEQIEATESGLSDPFDFILDSDSLLAQLDDGELAGFNSPDRLSYASLPGWYLPGYMVEDFPNVDTWQDLQAPEVLASFTNDNVNPVELLMVGEPSQNDNDIIELARIPIGVVTFSSVEALEAELLDRQENNVPALVQSSSPSPINRRFDFKIIETPSEEICLSGESCGYAELNGSKYISADLLERSPAVSEVLESFNLSDENYQGLTEVVAEAGDNSRPSQIWLDASPEVWQAWLPSS